DSVADFSTNFFGKWDAFDGSLVSFQLCFILAVIGSFVVCGFAALGVFLTGLPWLLTSSRGAWDLPCAAAVPSPRHVRVKSALCLKAY
ncbi:unnamed protein product, partial [Prorocentrum cordatum]